MNTKPTFYTDARHQILGTLAYEARSWGFTDLAALIDRVAAIAADIEHPYWFVWALGNRDEDAVAYGKVEGIPELLLVADVLATIPLPPKNNPFWTLADAVMTLRVFPPSMTMDDVDQVDWIDWLHTVDETAG